MPCPTNSRTTLNPLASTTCCTAAPTSPTVLPTLRASIPLFQRLAGHIQQLPQVGRNIVAYRHRDRRITVIAVQNHATVDGDDVAGVQHPRFRRDTVNDLAVHRSAKHAGIIVVTLECRLSAQFLDLLFSHALQIHGRAAWRHCLLSSLPAPAERCGRLRRIFSISEDDLQTIDILYRAERLRHYLFHRLFTIRPRSTVPWLGNNPPREASAGHTPSCVRRKRFPRRHGELQAAVPSTSQMPWTLGGWK